MFWHIFKYRLKTILHSKEEVFWILIFPIALGSCFYAAFSNIMTSAEAFSTIDVAVVYEDKSADTYFAGFMAVATNGDDAYLNVVTNNSKEAVTLLENDEITGIIYLKDGIPRVTFNSKGLYQTILKEVMNEYVQAVKTGERIQIKNHVVQKKFGSNNLDPFTDYYYSLIAMVCMFSAFSGQSCIENIKANLSKQGLRKSLAPVGKMTLILGDFFASLLMMSLSDLIIIIYLNYILKVNLGKDILLITVTAIIGTVIGLCNGMFIGAIPKLSQEIKSGLNTVWSLLLSFLSGLMVGGIKYDIEKVAPIVNRLNPSTQITNALYSLNVYDDYSKFLNCIGTLCIMSVILIFVCYLIIRRERYADL